MTKILLVGNSARAHIIAHALRKNHSTELYAFMGAKNPGITKLAKDIRVGNLDDANAIAVFAKEHKVDFAIIGPELPLSAGVADVLEEEGIPTIGPRKVLAQLETSKSFTRQLMEKYNIPGLPEFKAFPINTPIEEVKSFCERLGSFVIKADGLHGGKGVHVMGDHFDTVEEGLEICKKLIPQEAFVIEEKLEGEEFSYHFLTDGKSLAATPVAQDHKRAFEGDKGPNTGGMGSYSFPNHSLPFLSGTDLREARLITEKVLAALQEETGKTYRGVMYGGFMKTKDGIKLIEYNARFGDPEAMNIFSLLETDFTEVCESLIRGELDSQNVVFSPKATVCLYVVPKGYPTNPQKGEALDISNVDENVQMYFASVAEEEGAIIMSSSRAVAFVGIHEDIEVARQLAIEGIKNVKGAIAYRSDIATKELIQKRIDHMRLLC